MGQPLANDWNTFMALAVFLTMFALMVVIIVKSVITPSAGLTTLRHRAD